jgi:hypothetical protein
MYSSRSHNCLKGPRERQIFLSLGLAFVIDVFTVSARPNVLREPSLYMVYGGMISQIAVAEVRFRPSSKAVIRWHLRDPARYCLV